jgi:hypothetical protein
MNSTAAPKAPFRVQITTLARNPRFPHNGTPQQKLAAARRRTLPDVITKEDHFFQTEAEARAFADPINEARVANGNTGPSAMVGRLSSTGKTYQAYWAD